MKKIIQTLLLLVTISVYAQTPQQFNYQAVVRNSNGTTVANNTPVALRFTIHDGSVSGTAVFTETQNHTANQFGLVNVQIGSVSNLSTVTWGIGAKFLQVEVDVNNSGTFVDMGTSQLISVPYALFSGSSPSNISGTPNYLVKFTNTSTGGNSQIWDNGTSIGIGTTAPVSKLSLIQTGTASPTLELKNTSKGPNVSFGHFGPNGDWYLRSAADGGNVIFQDQAGGNVGVGTSAPSAKLDIIGSIKIADGTQGANRVLTSDANGLASWKTGYPHHIGDLYGGGIVVAVWQGNSTSAVRGLIASLTDLSSAQVWSNISSTGNGIGASAQSPSNGQANTTAIIGQSGHTTSAASLCNSYTSGGFSDWYLPSDFELNLCFNAAGIVNEVLGDANGFQMGLYWSSTESTNGLGGLAWYKNFSLGDNYDQLKSNAYRVRAVRKFFY